MSQISRFTGTKFMYRQPPYGFGIRFSVDDDKSVFACVIFDESKEGGRNVLHGGAMSAVLDEAMGTAAYEAHSAAVTAKLTIAYAAPVPLYEEILIRAWLEKVDGKKMFMKSSATLPNGTVAVTGEALFIASDALQKVIEHRPYIAKDES